LTVPTCHTIQHGWPQRGLAMVWHVQVACQKVTSYSGSSLAHAAKYEKCYKGVYRKQTHN